MRIAKTECDTTYQTWYDFKTELQKRSGRTVLNRDWMAIKPKNPLPWTKGQLDTALSRLERTDHQNRVRKQTTRRIGPTASVWENL
jgi:hypothetical protein